MTWSSYFFYSSDHGFQLGQFNIPMDKRQVYDWDTRIHLLMRGPGISKGSTFELPATQVDVAPVSGHTPALLCREHTCLTL
jgi:N-acetylglucosamine-6-sulfatase